MRGEGERPMNIVMWVLMALLAGLLAGLVKKHGSYGRGWDVVLGLAGSVAVSWSSRANGRLPSRGSWR